MGIGRTGRRALPGGVDPRGPGRRRRAGHAPHRRVAPGRLDERGRVPPERDKPLAALKFEVLACRNLRGQGCPIAPASCAVLPFDDRNPTNTGGSLEDAARREETRLRRAHPYRKEGGIFIFPSIHYVLSRYKNESPSVHHGKVESPVANLNAFLGTGFPRGRCTALIGDRGTHKSHLGYLQVLSGAVEQYREDPGSAGNGGELTIDAGETVPEFEEAAFALEPGGLSPVVETQYGFHVIELQEKIAGQMVPFEQVAPRIQQFLEQQGVQEQIESTVESLKKSGAVEVLI